MFSEIGVGDRRSYFSGFRSVKIIFAVEDDVAGRAESGFDVFSENAKAVPIQEHRARILDFGVRLIVGGGSDRDVFIDFSDFPGTRHQYNRQLKSIRPIAFIPAVSSFQALNGMDSKDSFCTLIGGMF